MKTKTLGIAFLTIILLLNFMTFIAVAGVPPEPHNADAMWVEPSSVTFDASNASVGAKFNVTVWLNMTENVFVYQIAMLYNRTQLKCARAAFTAVTTSMYMLGHGTTASGSPPVIDTSFLGNGSVLASESCTGSDLIPGPHNGSLIWAEFQVLVVPTAGNLTSNFDITTKYPTFTWVRDPDLAKIAITTYSAAYKFVGPAGPPPPPPPLSVSISPLSTTIHVGQTVHFTSTVSGGTVPYTFQWVLNGTPVLVATSNNWDFTPAASEFDVVYLAVTDNNGTIASSANASVTVTPPPGGTRIYVDPSEIIDLTMGPSSTFYINVTVANATDLGLCTFNLTYVPSVISWVGIEVFRVQGQFPIATVMLDGNAGFIWVSLHYSTPVSTDPPAPIVRIRFHVEAYGISPLNLTDTQLLDSGGHPITHDEFDGLFSNIIRDVAVTNVVPSTNWIYQGWSDDINVTVKNLGNVSETFAVSAYYNNSLIGTLPIVNLASNAETTTTITWNTTGVPEGNYTITGVASIVPYEYNTANNVYVDGIVQVVTVIHDVAITSVTPAKSWVYYGSPLKINVTAANLGNVSESFNVTAYADNGMVGTFPVANLASNAQITITFIWNTTSAQQCHNYTLRGEASMVPHEYNTTNNVYVDGLVTVRLVGDVNGDCVVDGADLAIIARAFGSYGPDYLYPGSPPHPRWNPEADLNGDDVVDGSDLVIASRNFGKSCPP
jgi:hypothetical protein